MNHIRSHFRSFYCIAITLMVFAFNISFTYGQTSCGIPTNIRVSNITINSAQIDWNSVTGATQYVIRFREVGSITWRRQTSYNTIEILPDLLPNTKYEVKIRSDCNGVIGEYSGLIFFTTLSNLPCSTPNVNYFAADSITANTCFVSWRNISEAIGYNIQYRIRFSNDVWIVKNSSTHSYLITGLDPSSQYEFRVQTVCNNGEGNFSLSGIFTTLVDICGPPLSLSVDELTTTSAILKWNSLECAASYNLKFRQGGMDWRILNTASTSFSLSDLAEGTAYEFLVQSKDSAGNTSAFSQPLVFYTVSESCVLPSNIVACAIEKNDVTIAWNSAPQASGYNVRYRLEGSPTWQYFPAEVNNAILNGLSPNKIYEFQVQSICNGPGGRFSETGSFTTLSDSSEFIPVPDHIVICIMENKSYSQMIGSFLMPHINALANDSKSAVFTKSYATNHPSQPNYLVLFSGSNQGVTNDNLPSQHFKTPNLARELIDAGKTFIAYNEGLPSVGYDESSFGKYVRKHNAVTNWMGRDTNQVSPILNQPLTSFPSDFNTLPTVSIVSPDLNNSMHDGSLGTALVRGDNWFNLNMIPYIEWAKTHNSLFILTMDEDDGSHNNNILTIFTGSMVVHGNYDQKITHFNVLRTIEEMYGLNFIGKTDTVSSIHGCWTNGFRIASDKSSPAQVTTEKNFNGFELYPNPASDKIHISIDLIEASEVSIKIYNNTGSVIIEDKTRIYEKGKHIVELTLHRESIPAGIYFIDVSSGNINYTRRFLINR